MATTLSIHLNQYFPQWFKQLVFGSFFLLFSVGLIAQDPTTINYNEENGLLSNEVYDLFEDRDGFIWMGTNKGAIRFDSRKMQTFTRSEGLADSDVLTLYQDRTGAIWFLSYNGKLSYWKDGKVYNEQRDERLKEIVSDSYFSSFLEDEVGNLWLGTFYSGIFRLDTSGKVKHFVQTSPNIVETEKPPYQLKFEVLHLYSDDSSNVFFSNTAATYQFNQEQFILKAKHENKQTYGRFAFNDQSLFSATQDWLIELDIPSGKANWKQALPFAEQVNALELLSDGLLYLATDNGVFLFDQKGKLRDSLLIGKQVSDVLIDREGNLWVSTLNEGVFLIKNREVLNYSTKAKYCILKTQDNLLFGGEGVEIHAYDQNGLGLFPMKYEFIYGISPKQDKIFTLVEDADHQLWFGSYGGLFQLKEGEAQLHILSGIKNVLFLKQSLFATASYDYLLRFDSEDIEDLHQLSKLANTPSFKKLNTPSIENHVIYTQLIHCFSQPQNGHFYAGTNEGIVYFDESKIHALKDLPLMKVVAIEEEQSSNLWLLDQHQGLFYYQTELEQLDTIELFWDQREVLYNNLYLEEEGSIWVATDQGVVHLSHAIENITYINKKHGIASEEINDLLLLNDTLWLATAEGISLFPKNSIEDTVAPLICIDSIWANHEAINATSSFKLTENENSLRVYFTGISFVDGGELQYEYNLQGKKSEKGKIESNVLSFSDLSPSAYTLKISALDSNGNRSRVQKITFSIPLVWWQNWKYWILILLSFALIFYTIIRLVFNKSWKEIYTLIKGKSLSEEKERFITVRSVTKGTLIKVTFSNIYFIKVSGDYTEFFTQEEVILVRSSMKRIEEELLEYKEFYRVHKSYMVNLKNIKGYKSDSLEILGQEIPVSRRKREEVKKIFLSFQ